MLYVFLCSVMLFLKISMIAQEIISNVLYYKKQFLHNGGITMQSVEMQDLLGVLLPVLEATTL